MEAMDFPAEKVRIKTSSTGSPPSKAHGRGTPGPESGFTLLELVAVLALLALMLGLVLPGLQRSFKRERDRATVRQLVVALRSGRSAAATSRERVRLFLDLNTGRYRLEGSGRGGELSGMRPAEAHLVWQDQGRRQGYIAFYGDGSSSGGYLALVDQSGQRHSLQVEIITGKVTLKTGGG
jgi:prepilin-type N-terminal cleavage/methylation domain-containing protein